MRILDKFDNTVHDVPQAIYDQWITQTDRFAPAPAGDPPAGAPQIAPQSSASDLVGSGATHDGFVEGQTVPQQPAPAASIPDVVLQVPPVPSPSTDAAPNSVPPAQPAAPPANET